MNGRPSSMKRSLHSSAARFVLIGGSAALLNLCLLWLFARQFDIWYLGASMLSYGICIVYNFTLQRAWAFQGEHRQAMTQFSQFLVANLAGLALNAVMLRALVETLRLPLIFSQAIASLSIATLSFVVYRRIFTRGRAVPRTVSDPVLQT